MSAQFRSDAPGWFREQLSRWMRNFGKQRGLIEHEVDDWFKRLGHFEEETIMTIFERVMNDEAITKWPTWAQAKRHVPGHGSDGPRPTAVDLSKMLVWSLDGASIGNMNALEWSKREDIARYVAGNLYGDGGALVRSQVEFIRALHPPTYEAIAANDWKLPRVSK